MDGFQQREGERRIVQRDVGEFEANTAERGGGAGTAVVGSDSGDG